MTTKDQPSLTEAVGTLRETLQREVERNERRIELNKALLKALKEGRTPQDIEAEIRQLTLAINQTNAQLHNISEVQIIQAKKEGTPEDNVVPIKAAPKKKPAPAKKPTKAAAKSPPKKKAAKKTQAKSKKTAPKNKPRKPQARSGQAPSEKTVNAATRGRRAVAAGERPKFKDAIALVMGSKQMNAAEVFDGLKEKGWTPDSEKPKEYVSFTLSREKDHFDKVSRGIYQVKPGVLDSIKAGVKTSKQVADPKSKAAKPAKESKSKLSDDQVSASLQDNFGIGKDAQSSGNPFSP